MRKINGQDYPVSLLKCWLPDQTLDKLEEIKDYIELRNNVFTLVYVIDGYHALMKQWQTQLDEEKTEEVKDSE